MVNIQAQPTHRKNTTITRFPAPRTNFPSISTGARVPTAGELAATGTGGGGGDSHACAVRGRLLTLIHLGGQAVAGASSRSLSAAAAALRSRFDVGGGAAGDAKFRASLGTPSFLRASFVPRLENMIFFISSSSFPWGVWRVWREEGFGFWVLGWFCLDPFSCKYEK